MSPPARLTSGPVGRALASLALPMLGGIASVIAFNLADTYFVSQLGTRPLAAISFTFPVVMVLFGIAFGLTTGTTAAVSKAIGEGHPEGIRRLSSDALLLALLVVLVAAGLGMATIDPLFVFLGADADLLPVIRDYMLIWYPGMVFLVVPMVANGSIRAGGDAKFPALIIMGSTLSNIALDPILIFGWFGLPRLEIQGAAIATVISRAGTMVAALVLIHYRDRMIDFSLPNPKLVWQSWKTIAQIAVPATVTNIMGPAALGVVTRLISTFGAEAVAAWGAGMRISFFALIPTFAVCSALVPLIGQNWGAELYPRVHLTRLYSYRFALVWGLFANGALYLFATPIARLFSEDPAVIDQIRLYLHIVPFGYALVGVFQVAEDVLNTIGRPFVSALQTFVYMFLLYIPLAHLGGRWSDFTGLLWGLVAADILAGILGLVLMWRLCRPPAKAKLQQ